MEQKKTLWIIAAVSVFLLVVLGVALIYTSSSSEAFETNSISLANTNPASNKNSNGLSTEENTAPKDTEQDYESMVQQVKDMFVVSENTTILDLNNDGSSTTIDLNALKNQHLFENTNTDKQTPNADANSVVVTRTENTPAQNEATEYYVGNNTTAAKAEQIEKATSVKQTEPKSSVTVKSTGTKTTSNTTKTTTAGTTKTTSAAPAPKAITRFWVQVASYSNKKTAENSRTILNDNKISSDIYTYQDAKGNLFYRVRVGPFTTKSEAEYWMSKITQIKDFSKAGSYVTNTTDK